MSNKIICITGATAGIGEATAHLFAQNNWNVIITGRRMQRLKTLAATLQQQYGVEVLPLCFDVQDVDAVKHAVESLNDAWRQIDVLVNNAGLAVGKEAFQTAEIADWERMIDTNVKGLLYMSRLVVPLMITNKKGHIINVSSIAGKEVYAGGHVYCATKHAVDALCKGLRIDLLKHRIKVTSINPGLVETEFSIVRFKGDVDKAKQVYTGFMPLIAQDIADNIYYAATRPPHVNINEIIVTCTAQANAHHLIKDADLA